MEYFSLRSLKLQSQHSKTSPKHKQVGVKIFSQSSQNQFHSFWHIYAQRRSRMRMWKSLGPFTTYFQFSAFRVPDSTASLGCLWNQAGPRDLRQSEKWGWINNFQSSLSPAAMTTCPRSNSGFSTSLDPRVRMCSRAFNCPVLDMNFAGLDLGAICYCSIT